MKASAEPSGEAGASRCARCGAAFVCGMQAGASECWCRALPPLAPLPGRNCLCRGCLEEELGEAAQASRTYRT